MGTVAFEWGYAGKLTLFQNLKNWEQWVVKPAAWDEGSKILGGRLAQNGGTWCGVSSRGRVAFLVDPKPTNTVTTGSELLPIAFLKGAQSPHDFAREVAKKQRQIIHVFHLIVADTVSESMVYIGKRNIYSYVQPQDVSVGLHILSLDGLDSPSPTYQGMATNLTAIFGTHEDRQLPQLKDIAERLMTDRDGDNPFFEDMMGTHERLGVPPPPTTGVVPRSGTTSTTSLQMTPNGKVIFYERYLENGEWKDHDFTFNVVA